MGFRLLQGLLLALAAWQWGEAGWIHAKAVLAQYLIADAWQRTLEGEARARPWPWADTWPVARMRVPASGVDLYVLAGSGGHALAFGPGYDESTALPGRGGSVIGGHRDTHFAFLKSLALRAHIEVQTEDGRWHSYAVAETRVGDVRRGPLLIDRSRDMLWLVTCYPFEAIQPGGPLRYIVVAEQRKAVTSQ